MVLPKPTYYLNLTLFLALCTSLSKEIHRWLPDILPRIMKVFQIDHTPTRDATSLALDTLVVIGPPLVDYTHLVIPALVGLFEIHLTDSDEKTYRALLELSMKAMQTTGKLAKYLNLKDFSGRLLQPLLRILELTGNTVSLTSSTSSLASSTSSLMNLEGNESLQQLVIKLFCDIMDHCSAAKDEYVRYDTTLFYEFH